MLFNVKSFGYVTGLKNSSFNAIKVFKKVMGSQREGKDNAMNEILIVDGLLIEDLS
jgi:hypothetical protein